MWESWSFFYTLDEILSTPTLSTPKRKRKRTSPRQLIPKAVTRSFDHSKFNIPSHFRQDINENLQKKVPLLTTQENKICQILTSKISEQTLQPFKGDLRIIMQKFLVIHDYLIFNNNKEATLVSFYCHLRDYLTVAPPKFFIQCF